MTDHHPFEPMPQELLSSGKLVTLKMAASANETSAATLKANAKASRLKAYQQHHGSPLMVLPADVEAFLKARPDIASRFHQKPTAPAPKLQHASQSRPPEADGGFPFPDAVGMVHGPGDLGFGLTLHSLDHATPEELALVAACLNEVSRLINDIIPSNARNLP